MFKDLASLLRKVADKIDPPIASTGITVGRTLELTYEKNVNKFYPSY